MSFRTLTALVLASLLFSASGRAQTSGETSSSANPGERQEKERLTAVGTLIDAGFPDGFALSLVYRPFLYTRIDAGATYNFFGYGVRGGLTLVPFRFAVVPTLRFEAGHMFESDASKTIKKYATLSKAEEIVLKRMSYDYLSAQLGLEFGSQNRFLFFLRGGLAYVSTTLKDFQSAVREAGVDATVEVGDPKIKFTAPSANLGFLVFIY